jgi:hypothetical protein
MPAQVLTSTDVKFVQMPIEPRLAPPVDFDCSDAAEWGHFALKSQRWQVHCAHVTAGTASKVEAAVAIAAPDGRVAVWYGQVPARAVEKQHTKRHNVNRRTTTDYLAVRGVTGCAAFAACWDPKRTLGGDRDVSALAMAAGRVLHAEAFGEAPSPRDLLLAEFALLVGADRPDTTVLLQASDNALTAASALVAIKNFRGACALLAGQGVTA